MNGISIREMKIMDYQEIYQFWINTPGLGLSEDDSEENVKIFLARNPGLCFVAEKAGRIVGTLFSGHDGRRGFLYHLAVSPEVRKQGLGHQLVETALKALKAAGIRKCHLLVFHNNTDAHQFYSAIGWTKRDDIFIFSKNI